MLLIYGMIVSLNMNLLADYTKADMAFYRCDNEWKVQERTVKTHLFRKDTITYILKNYSCRGTTLTEYLDEDEMDQIDQVVADNHDNR